MRRLPVPAMFKGPALIAALMFSGLGMAQEAETDALASDAATETGDTSEYATDDVDPVPPETSTGFIPTEDDLAIQTAEVLPKVSKSLILDIANGANRAVAVGERGHILVSESRRGDWRQIQDVPTRSTLTAVSAIGDRVVAVGHDGIILLSTDGGLTWNRKRLAPFVPDNMDLKNGAPLLDVLMYDDNNGFAIGAYSLLLKTSDGGESWQSMNILGKSDEEVIDTQETDTAAANDENWTFDQSDLDLEEETDPHLNSIARTGDGSFMIVAERGAAFRSIDAGTTWERIQLPYEGSMFGVIGYEGRHVLAFGLRGNVYESFDLGDNWTQLETGTELSLMGGTGWQGGGAALVGANGAVLVRTSAEDTLKLSAAPDGTVLSSVLAITAGELSLAGESGMSFYQP